MRYPWITAALLVVLVVTVFVAYRRSSRLRNSDVAWLANTASLRELPAYLEQKRRTRFSVALFALFAGASAIAVSVAAGAPVKRHVEHPRLTSRDIVLCLDSSGSMLPYGGQILRQFDELIEHFQGERLSLQLWSAQTVTKFPLTDDYELINEVLEEGASVIDSGYLGPQGDYVLVTPELADYLEGIEAPEGQRISSLVGDGLASCVLGFDQRDTERSRTILLATDNEVMGDQIYTLTQAVKFASDQGIDIIALYPSDGGPLTAEGEQLRNVVESSGGSFYVASDPSAIPGILDQVETGLLADVDGGVTTVETDVPEASLAWVAWSFLGVLVVAAVRRL